MKVEEPVVIPEPLAEVKPPVVEKKKATEPQDLIIQRKIYPSISMCSPFIV